MINAADRLERHLTSWVGQWPPPADGVTVVGDPSRALPTWDGSIRLLQGVGNGTATVISVPPPFVEAVTEALADGMERPDVGDELGTILGVGAARLGTGVFRTTLDVDDAIPDTGEWHEQQTDGLPARLAPFNGPRLVVRDGDTVIAGVGIKIHDDYGHELAVVTDEAARGRGLARQLVATAARRVLDRGAVPIYLHQRDNQASARVAQAVGFTDRGWTVHGLWPRDSRGSA
jgi:GNAT superfamily N-acetyltransferase